MSVFFHVADTATCLHFGPSWLHVGSSWLHLGQFGRHLGSSWPHLGSILSHLGYIFAPSWLHLEPSCLVFVGFCQTLTGCWHDWKSQPILFGGDPRGTAISRSDLNPPHPSFTTGAKRSRQRFVLSSSAELGELASPYPSTSLRVTADPPDVRNYFCDAVNCFRL